MKNNFSNNTSFFTTGNIIAIRYCSFLFLFALFFIVVSCSDHKEPTIENTAVVIEETKKKHQVERSETKANPKPPVIQRKLELKAETPNKTTNLIQPKSNSPEVKYFLTELDKVVDLTKQQGIQLENLVSNNIIEKAKWIQRLDNLRSIGEENLPEGVTLKQKIKDKQDEEKQHLITVLTQEQYALYTRDKKKKGYRNQIESMNNLLVLSAAQQSALLDLLIKQGSEQEKAVSKFPNFKQNKEQARELTKLRASIKNDFNNALSEELTAEQFDTYERFQTKKRIKPNLDKIKTQLSLQSNKVEQVESLLIEYEIDKRKTIGEEMPFDAKVRELNQLKSVLDQGLQQVLSDSQFEKYQSLSYTKDKSKRKYTNQLAEIDNIMELTDKQKGKLEEILSEYGVQKDRLNSQFPDFKKDKKQFKQFIKAQGVLKESFLADLSTVLSKDQVVVYERYEARKRLRQKLTSLDQNLDLSANTLKHVKQIIVDYDIKKRKVIGEQISFSAKVKKLNDLKETLYNGLQKEMTPSQIEAFENVFPKI